MARHVDRKVFDLAQDWLDGEDTDGRGVKRTTVERLAQFLQQAIEDWCQDEQDREEAAKDRYWDQKIDEARGL